MRARARGSLTDALGDRLEVVDVTVTAEDSTLSALVVYRPEARRRDPQGHPHPAGGGAMTVFDAYTQPEQPRASPVLRPKALFAGGGVVGLRAASTTVSGASRTVSVWLYDDPQAGSAAAALWSFQGSPAVTLTGPGTVIAAATDPDGNPVPAHIDLPVQAAGAALPGRAPYRLGIDPAGLVPLGLELDPLRRYLPVRLRPECGDVPDCITIPDQPAPLTPPDYDTLARDYSGLRAMLAERLAALAPDSDQSPADVTITLMELMAHLGDLLSYRLDRVATETWLPTARQRATVTRHARLVDFAVLPAISAATFVQVQRRHQNAGPNDGNFVVQPGDTRDRRRGRSGPGTRRRALHPGDRRAGQRCSPRTAKSRFTTGRRRTPSSPPTRPARCSCVPRQPTANRSRPGCRPARCSPSRSSHPGRPGRSRPGRGG